MSWKEEWFSQTMVVTIRCLNLSTSVCPFFLKVQQWISVWYQCQWPAKRIWQTSESRLKNTRYFKLNAAPQTAWPLQHASKMPRWPYAGGLMLTKRVSDALGSLLKYPCAVFQTSLTAVLSNESEVIPLAVTQISPLSHQPEDVVSRIPNCVGRVQSISSLSPESLVHDV